MSWEDITADHRDVAAFQTIQVCFNHSLRLLPGTLQVVHGLFKKYLLQARRFAFVVHDCNCLVCIWILVSIRQVCVCVGVCRVFLEGFQVERSSCCPEKTYCEILVYCALYTSRILYIMI